MNMSLGEDMDAEKSAYYFDSPGKVNTEETLKLAKRRAEELGIRDIVVATTSGQTSVRVSELFKGFNVVVDTHYT